MRYQTDVFTNNQNNPNPNSTGTSNTQNPFGMDLGQLTQMLQGMGDILNKNKYFNRCKNIFIYFYC